MTSPPKRWDILPPAPTDYAASLSDLSPLLVQLLYNRSILTAEEAGAFLSCAYEEGNPFRLKGMSEAVTRLRQALRAHEPIAVYGDYDVDGVSATALLVPVLSSLGATVTPYIPSRMEEGYGLNVDALQQLAQQGIKLVVTVDCGARSVAEAEAASRLGLDLIITDHHTPGDALPQAVAVIDPKREDDAYPFKQLAGVGLAFKLGQALLKTERQVPLCRECSLPKEEDWLDLVALGTIADLAPLVGENRTLVCRGLTELRQARRPGVAAMLQEAAVLPQNVDAYVIGFVLGPRLNAAGRLESAFASYELLTTLSQDRARVLADQLGGQNRERQKLMLQGVEKARQEVVALGDQRVYVLADEGYLVGLAGLVASRITEEFHRPSVVIALEPDVSRGSARSISTFHITRALDECRGLMERHGGHAAAAGLTIRNENIDSLRSELLRIADRDLTEEDLVPSLKIDWVQPLTDVNGNTWQQIELLRPFGVGNPTPVLASANVEVREARSIGTDRPGLKLKLSDGRAVWDAVAFQGVTREQLAPRIDVAYTLQRRTWNGQTRLEMIIKDVRPAGYVAGLQPKQARHK